MYGASTKSTRMIIYLALVDLSLSDDRGGKRGGIVLA